MSAIGVGIGVSFRNLPGIATSAFALVATAALVGNAANATTTAINTTGANLIVIGTSYVTAGTISDSKGNVWTPRTVYVGVVAASVLYYCYNPIVGAGHTFTSSGGATVTIGALAFSGSAAAPYDKENGFGSPGSVSAIQPGSITPSQTKELVIGMVAWNNGGTSSIDSGFIKPSEITNVPNNSLGTALFYLIETSIVAVNPTVTLTPAADFASVAFAAFKAA